MPASANDERLMACMRGAVSVARMPGKVMRRRIVDSCQPVDANRRHLANSFTHLKSFLRLPMVLPFREQLRQSLEEVAGFVRVRAASAAGQRRRFLRDPWYRRLRGPAR